MAVAVEIFADDIVKLGRLGRADVGEIPAALAAAIDAVRRPRWRRRPTAAAWPVGEPAVQLVPRQIQPVRRQRLINRRIGARLGLLQVERAW
jgi:hypothetical protein